MELEYEGRAQAESLDFSSYGHQEHTLMLRHASQASRPMLFKVQCTAPRALRVRPALGILAALGDSVSIQVQLIPQEWTLTMCKLLVVGRQTASGTQGKQLKTMWAAAEACPDTLTLSETVQIRLQNNSNLVANDAISIPLSSTPQLTTTRLTTAQVAELVLLLMKSQSSREENALTTDEKQQLRIAKSRHSSSLWVGWEEYAMRMRKLLREHKKRKTSST